MENKTLFLKTLPILIVVLFTLTIFNACKKEETLSTDAAMVDYRTMAWNYLTESQKSTVIIDWRIAPIKDATLDGKPLKTVTFATTQDAILGPIIVYISVETNTVMGVGGRF